MDDTASVDRRSAAKTAGWLFGLDVVGPAVFMAFGLYRLGIANGIYFPPGARTYDSSPTGDPAFWVLAAVILGASLLLLMLYVSEIVHGRRFLVGAALLGCAIATTALFWWALMARPDLPGVTVSF